MKAKALFFNFIGFAFFFIIFRYLSIYVVPATDIYGVVIAAILANVVAPKFGVIDTDTGKKMMMKCLFIKELREIK
jgi:glycerol-3-phosphate dehydrogenase